MGIIDSLKSLFGTSTTARERKQRQRRNSPSHTGGFFHSITWRCNNCKNEFYWLDEDEHLTCHHCETAYTLRMEDFPELLRAKCWNCGEISDSINGFRMENIRFECPRCHWEWESSPY